MLVKGPQQLPQPAADEERRRAGRQPVLRPRAKSSSFATWSPGPRRPTTARCPISSFRPLPQVWDEIHSDSGNCMGRKCPTYKDCFYYQARRRVSNAHILVVNHALFFSDLALRRAGASILPDHDIVIFDEAHTIEQVAGDHLGLGVIERPDRVHCSTSSTTTARTAGCWWRTGWATHSRPSWIAARAAEEFFDSLESGSTIRASRTAACASRRSWRTALARAR